MSKLIEKVPIKSRKSIVVDKNRENSWIYSIKTAEINTQVCKTFVMRLFQVTSRRLNFVKTRLNQPSINMSDYRGKAENPKKIPSYIFDLVLEHLALLPHSESHYTDSKRLYFEDSSLTIKDIFISFQEFFLSKNGTPLKMQYNTYHRWFRENSPYSLQKPRTDVCDFCAKCKIKLKINPNDACKEIFDKHTELIGQYVKKKKTEILKNCKKDTSTLVFEFDYGQNLVCPKLNVNSHYYNQKLVMNVFNIHCHNDKNSAFYWFCEHTSSKTSDTVSSFLQDFVKLYLPNEKVKKNHFTI